MGYLEGSKLGYEQTVNPFAVVLDQVNASFERRRAEEAKRAEEETQLKNLFKQLSMKSDMEIEQKKKLQPLEDQSALKKSMYERGYFPQGTLQSTPMGAVGDAMNQGQTLSPRQDMGAGIVQQAGLSPQMNVGGITYEKDPNQTPEEYKRSLEVRELEEKLSDGNKTKRDKIISLKEKARDQIRTIEEIEKNMGYFGLASYLPGPGTSKANWDANFKKLKSQQTLDLLKDLKQQSSTGATGLGNTNLKEFGTLESAATNLIPTLSQKDAKRYLILLKTKFKNIADAPFEDEGQFGQSMQSNQYVKTGTLPDGRKVGVKQDGTTEIINGQ